MQEMFFFTVSKRYIILWRVTKEFWPENWHTIIEVAFSYSSTWLKSLHHVAPKCSLSSKSLSVLTNHTNHFKHCCVINKIVQTYAPRTRLETGHNNRYYRRPIVGKIRLVLHVSRLFSLSRCLSKVCVWCCQFITQ